MTHSLATLALSREHNSLPSDLPHQTTDIISLTGLFAPKQGQAYREEQRRRRSQFDRGTPGAENELDMNRLRTEDVPAGPPRFRRYIPHY